MQAQFYKTKMCPLFEKGRCFNGRKCRYAHSDSELRELPDLRCTKLCESVLKGEPCKSDNCTFAHTREELRTSHITFHKVSLCNFYKKGRCLNGGTYGREWQTQREGMGAERQGLVQRLFSCLWSIHQCIAALPMGCLS